MRKRRRQNVTWFPNLGTAGHIDSAAYSGRSFDIDVPGTGVVSTLIVPVTMDSPQETLDVSAGDPLVAIIGSEYLVKRIVGKIHIGKDSQLNTQDPEQTMDAVLVTCGWFCARAGDNSSSTEDLPVGGNANATDAQQTELYGPQHPNVIREPWMWRRQWILGNATAAVTIAGNLQTFPGLANFPETTADYGSVSDGPHFDVKVRRRVSSDDRLWFVVSCRSLISRGNLTPIANQATEFTTGKIRGLLDYRILGTLRKAHNRGVF